MYRSEVTDIRDSLIALKKVMELLGSDPRNSINNNQYLTHCEKYHLSRIYQVEIVRLIDICEESLKNTRNEF